MQSCARGKLKMDPGLRRMTGDVIAIKLDQSREYRHPGASRDPVSQRATLNRTPELGNLKTEESDTSMCGIAGELRFNDAPTEGNWERISRLMVRRGPDDDGRWDGGGRCTLVFRRLSILDLSPAGHQPMTAHDGRFAIAFNGEIYNFAELRKQLEARGVVFRSHGDTEVVLHALIEWGKSALDKFNGMFALAFYDCQERTLLLARDHAGIKPLYYLVNKNGVMFGSQYDQLLAHPWSHGLTVAEEALGLYLRLAFVPAPFGILRETYSLEPGCWLEFGANGLVNHGRYTVFPRYAEPTLRGDAANDAVDAAISAAVKRQLVSDVPLGAFLSGGVDSPLVVAKMKASGVDNVTAFTIATGEAASDESGDAQAYARELGVKQVIERVTPDTAVELLDDVISACGEPFGDYSIFPTMLVSRLARREFTVMLSGDGGDELFWGYAKRAGPMMQACGDFQHGSALRWLTWALRKLSNSSMPRSHLRSYRSLGDWHRTAHVHLPENCLQRIFPRLGAWPQQYDVYDYHDWQDQETAQWLRWNEFISHLTMVLLKVDRASMWESLEVRVPLLDREVISTALQVDWRSCLDTKSMTGKLPLRAVLSRHVKHQTQVKRGFEIPMANWLRTTLKPVVEENLLQRDEMLGMPMDRAAMRQVYQEHLQGHKDYAWGLWPLLSLALWEKRHWISSRRQESK